jgi:hypothetical protein
MAALDRLDNELMSVKRHMQQIKVALRLKRWKNAETQ